MSKFNKIKKTTKVINHVGSKAFKESDEFELASLVLTSFVENMYYEDTYSQMSRMENLINKIDSKFAAKLAIYARDQFHMRSMSHVVAAIMAKYNLTSGKSWSTDFYNNVIQRPDDMSEIISLYWKDGKKKLPNALKRGFKKAFDKFDDYQIAKYKMKNRDISLVDIINMVRPKPTKNNINSISGIINNKSVIANTWESKLTQAGQNFNNEKDKSIAKGESWTELIISGKIGYFALLKNLRNILTYAPNTVDKVCDLLTDEKLLTNSKVLPFRFISAYNAINKYMNTESDNLLNFDEDKNKNDNVIKIKKALNKALEISVQNLPYIPGNTIILSDNSASMGSCTDNSLVSAMSSIDTSDIANLFATLFWTRCENTAIGLFGDRCINPILNMNRDLSIFENFDIITQESKKCGGSTEQGIFDMLNELINKNNTDVDRIIIFSDCQIGSNCSWYDTLGNRGDGFNMLYGKYKKINPKVKVYSITLKGYGDTVFNSDVYKLAGWSNKIFDLISVLEQDKNAFINDIKKVEL